MKNIQISRAIVLLSMSLTCVSVGAKPPIQEKVGSIGLRPSYDKCGDASDGITVNILNCNADEYRYQNERLNRGYKTLTDKLSVSEQVKLRDEQRKWISYRDSYCAPDKDGGTRAAIESSSCLVGETAKQATALEARPGQPPALTQYEGEANGLRPSYIQCIKATRGIGPESQSCVDAEYTYQDARLNKAYQALMAELSKNEQAELRANQKIWIAFRDSHCTHPQSEQAQHLTLNDCLVEETAKQAITLEDRLFFLEK